LSAENGVLGRSAEESIRNLSRISLKEMELVDPTVVQILEGKTPPRGRA
jgi:L-cysteine desulfidase